MKLLPPELVEAASRRLRKASKRQDAASAACHRQHWSLPQRYQGHAYSLIEVLIASGILLTGIAAVAMMAHTMFLQEEGNGRVTRAINLQEQAATLWQLGLSPDTITNILPERCVASNSLAADTVCLTFSNNADITNLGINAAQSVNLTIVFHSATAANGTLIYQTNTNVTVVRPSTR